MVIETRWNSGLHILKGSVLPKEHARAQNITRSPAEGLRVTSPLPTLSCRLQAAACFVAVASSTCNSILGMVVPTLHPSSLWKPTLYTFLPSFLQTFFLPHY